ncbi:MAG TPA: hypothetical protein VGO62_18565, partial [Myxococcota bacterium]
MRAVLPLLVTTGFVVVLASACPPPATRTTPVSIAFEPKVGAQDLKCGVAIDQLGTTPGPVQLADLRMYISGLKIG